MPTFTATLAMALAFCAVHIFVGKLRFLDVKPRSRWLSLSGGVAVAYVFMHIMPELAAHGPVFEREIGLDVGLAETAVYTLALTGLVLFYGIERAIVASRADRSGEGAGRDVRGHGRRPGNGIFWVHIAASSALVVVVAYLLNHREDNGALGLVLFFGALLLHFVTADFASRAHHREIYDRAGRWLLVLATLTGWALGVWVELPELVVGFLFAFVGGGMVLIALKEELPEERESAFLPFLAGAALYSALVVAEQVWA